MSPGANVGRPIERVDGRAKVTGQATYSAEWQLPHMTHAVLVTSAISKGRIVALDTRAAEAAPGVVAVLTHRNAKHPSHPPDPSKGGPNDKAKSHGTAQQSGPKPIPDPGLVLQDETIHYSGQPIAVVIADSLHHAQGAAALVKVRYQEERPEVDLDAHLPEGKPPSSIFGEPPDNHRGDFMAGWDAADVHVDQVYVTSAESHNPMEPHATTAVYQHGKLTLYDATQYVFGVKRMVAGLVGMKPEHVRVVCRYVGGGFGSKGMMWPHVVCAALAALKVERPVKLVVERRQMFGLVGFRPRTHQRVRLAARKDGTLTAVGHDGTNQTSRIGEFVEPVATATRMLYACPNVSVTHRVVPLDTQTPTFQRAPGESSGVFALEVAMDELAEKLGMDPVALRLKNYATKDGDKNVPFSSKALDQCYRQGADAFGWSRRPKGTRNRDGNMLVGWGMATATYPAHRSGATARVTMDKNGRVRVQIASHDLGTGTYTILSQVAADALGVPVSMVVTELGDTDYPEAPVSGGSQSAASASNAVHAAAVALRGKLQSLADAHQFETASFSDAGTYAEVLRRANQAAESAEATTKPGAEAKEYSSHAWGAQFAEVHVDPDLGIVRVKRMLGAFAAGRVINPRTARSQFMGGMIMGLGMALLEEVERDPRQGRVVNASLADYLVPVNADVPSVEIMMIHEDDPHVNPLGIKGLGEIGIVGAAAAIANAVHHATGVRVRDLPIKLEHLI